MVWLCALLACSNNNDDDNDPPDTETGTPSDTDETTSACVSDLLGPDGGVLEDGGVALDVPPNALLNDGVQVELCLVEGTDPALLSGVWEVGPADLEIVLPLQLRIDHTADEVTSAMFTPAPDGDAWRNLQAGRPAQGTLEAPLYRPGQAWVAEDARSFEPYVPDPVSSNEADLLFVIDNSCSMYDEQLDLADHIPTLLTALEGSGLDYHIGVVSTDMDDPTHSGKLREVAGDRWIDPSAPNPQQMFTSMAGMGTNGSTSPSGLGAAYVATDFLQATYNAGFYRPNATLGVVVLSDEADQTPKSVIGQDEFVTWLDTLKGSPRHTALHGIVSAGGTGMYSGQIYIDAADQTGGLHTSIQQPKTWPIFLADIAASVALQPDMAITAVEGTVEGWHVPANDEQEPIDPVDVLHDVDNGRVRIDHTLSEDEVFVLYVPEE